jgi:hypothetical protein
MPGKSIYPSVPSPGNDEASMRTTLDAVRQSMTMIIMNAQEPNTNYTPSSAAQVFVTNAGLNTAVANQLAASKKAVGAAAAPAAARAALARGAPTRVTRVTSLPVQVVSTRLP